MLQDTYYLNILSSTKLKIKKISKIKEISLEEKVAFMYLE